MRSRCTAPDYAASRLPAASFDAVCAIESACHGEGATKAMLLREANRLLRPDGTFIMVDAMLLDELPTRGVLARLTGAIYLRWCSSWAVPELCRSDLLPHALEVGWPMMIEQGKEVMVHNTGAFQRTIDEDGFLARFREKDLKASQALRTIKLEDLPPCYSAVLVTYRSAVPDSKTWRWHMPENGKGSLVEPGDERCN